MSTGADISFHIIKFALQRVHEGDLTAALDLGFTVDEIRSMESLTLKDLSYLSRLSAHFLRLEVDHDTCQAMLRRVHEESASEALQDAMLRQGAPRNLMQELFGWSALQHAARRKLLGIQSTPGRPPQPTEQQEHEVWEHWHRLTDIPLPERYLETAQSADVSIATICKLLQLWETTGLKTAPETRHSSVGGCVLPFRPGPRLSGTMAAHEER